MLQCFANQNAHVYIKHGDCLYTNNKNTKPKGEHSCTELSLKRKEGIMMYTKYEVLFLPIII